MPQLFFDDYIFTKSDKEGTYITALYDEDGNFIDGTAAQLKERYSADMQYANVPGNQPVLFTALLNKKDVEDCAVNNTNYYKSRVSNVMKRFGLDV